MYLMFLFGLFMIAALPLRSWLKRIEFAPRRGTLAAIGFVFGAVGGTATWVASLIVRRMGRDLHSWIISGIILCAGIFFIFSATADLLSISGQK